MLTDLESIASRLRFSPEAVAVAWSALQVGRSMAQFDHAELGGRGQWMPGMLMIADMFNDELKGRVNQLFHELAKLPPESKAQTPSSFSYGMREESGKWYPSEFGSPAVSGSQNNFRYAWFPDSRRLAIEHDGKLTLYDTGDHIISGVAQGQTDQNGFITFASQSGVIRVSDLRRVG